MLDAPLIHIETIQAARKADGFNFVSSGDEVENKRQEDGILSTKEKWEQRKGTEKKPPAGGKGGKGRAKERRPMGRLKEKVTSPLSPSVGVWKTRWVYHTPTTPSISSLTFSFFKHERGGRRIIFRGLTLSILFTEF